MTAIQSKNGKPNIYLPNLDGLRFIAALFVFIDHNQAIKDAFLIPHQPPPFQLIIGKLGVVLFFVLSGVLITYLLLREQAATQHIAIKKFYIRRILRIWPLYFLIIAFALFIAPRTSFFTPEHFDSALNNQNFIPILLLFIGFLPNAVLTGFGTVPYAAQTWSVGVEEQFYLLWPWLIRKVRHKALLFPAIFIGYQVIKVSLMFLQHRYPRAGSLLSFWYYCNIDCMALGAWGAYLVFTKQQRILRILFNPYVQWINYLLIAFLIGKGVAFRYMHFEIYGLLFTIAILNLAFNSRSVCTLTYKPLQYLGKISYGIYMYHFIALAVAVRILQMVNGISGMSIFLLGLAITLLMASLSYHYFETPFLKLKARFAIFDRNEPNPSPAK